MWSDVERAPSSRSRKICGDTVACDEPVDTRWISREDDVNETCDARESPLRGAQLAPRAVARLARYSRTTVILSCAATSWWSRIGTTVSPSDLIGSSSATRRRSTL